MKRIKVLHVTSSPGGGIGGVERLLLDMARNYDLSRFDVWHCNLFDRSAGRGPFPTALKATGLPFLEIRGSGWHHLPRVTRQLLLAVRRQGFDIVHLHMVHATILGSLVARPTGMPRIVVTKHYASGAVRNPLLRLMDRFVTNRADQLAAVSSHVRDDVIANGADRSRTRIIHNGIDLEAFERLASEPPGQLDADNEHLLIGCVGNLNAIKGHEYLVRAMPDILRAFPSARLILIGEGSERERIEKLTGALGVDHAVSVPGFIKNVPATMRRVDLCVQPSLQEAFGIVLLEAMAAGRPVVASHVEGIPEIVVDGVTGFLVPPRDPGAIADAVCNLLADEGLRKKLGSAGRDRIVQKFDVRQTVRSYEQLYCDVVAAP